MSRLGGAHASVMCWWSIGSLLWLVDTSRDEVVGSWASDVVGYDPDVASSIMARNLRKRSMKGVLGRV